MNNQSPNTNNQIITNHQFTNNQTKFYFGHWLLDIRIYLVIVSWLLVIVSSAFADEKFFEVRAKKFSYTPNIIRVNKGDLVKVRLISEDVTHGMFVDGYGVNTSAHPGQEGYLEFLADKPGRFSFRCSVTCGEFHPYMIGYLVVGPNIRFYAYVLLVVLTGLGVFLGIRNKKIKNG